ncbi:MAG: phosphosulfolactate synthase [Geodermatophilaceae bacterium]|nr:phosphosulfolactate synthase [Geodermatophilaceae bacterium]
MTEGPTFLELPARLSKPRVRGITHLLDKGLPPRATEDLLSQAAHLIDIVKIGWGIGYLDPTLPRRIASYAAAGVPVCLGGTLTEIVAHQDRVGQFRDWALSIGISHVEVSNGLQALSDDRKLGLIKELCADFVVLAETGSKDGNYPTTPHEWVEEMTRDLDAGAEFVVAEGRESGNVGLYHADQAVHEEIVSEILMQIPQDRIIFEAPVKAQQTWFITTLGAEVNLGNIEPSSVLPLETLRLGLRADTAVPGPSG